MKTFQIICSLAFFGATIIGPGRSVAVSRIPIFQAESVQDFETALQRVPHRALETAHHDHTGYRAFRFLDRDMVLIGVASSVFVDPTGKLHVVQAHGESMGGHPNKTHQEYSHILLPPNVALPHP